MCVDAVPPAAVGEAEGSDARRDPGLGEHVSSVGGGVGEGVWVGVGVGVSVCVLVGVGLGGVGWSGGGVGGC